MKGGFIMSYIEDYGEYATIYKHIPTDELIIIPERYCGDIDEINDDLYVKFYHRLSDDIVRETYISLESARYVEGSSIKLTESEKEDFIDCITDPGTLDSILYYYNQMREEANLSHIDKIDLPDYSSLETENNLK